MRRAGADYSGESFHQASPYTNLSSDFRGGYCPDPATNCCFGAEARALPCRACSSLRGFANMRRTRSIRTRLSLVFLFLFGLVALLGAFGIGSLSYFNGASSRVRDRSLPSTRVLGDLNNLTSDFRAAEAASLLASNSSELAEIEKEMVELDRGISVAQLAYRQIRHDSAEDALYEQFTHKWDEYRNVVRKVEVLSLGSERASAIGLFKTNSKTAYDAASDTLGLLTDRNVANAREASARSDLAYSRALWLIILTILCAGLLVAAAMTYVRRSISAPLLDLTGRMLRLAANETNIEIEGEARHDEIGEMARAVVVFRDNAIELVTSRHGLAQQASMLQEKLAEEQRLMRLQRNFVSMASHEFRTPLTIIDAHAQRLISMKERLGTEQLVERARKIRSAVSRMTHLIHNLIDSSRAIDGDIELYFHPSATDLAALLREVCQLQREIAPQARILEDIPTPLHIVGDPNLLFQVFSNLLSNAVKYSPGAGLIKVTAALADSEVLVAVADHGIGVAEADHSRLFERYYRGSNTAGIVGTGIGLYFVKMVVELHGGDIDVESAEGSGSRFTVRLPCKSRASNREDHTNAEEGASCLRN
jgi:two-component system OmpR family sensor kinase